MRTRRPSRRASAAASSTSRDLPDSGLTGNQQQCAGTGVRALHRLEEARTLAGAADEWRALPSREDAAGLGVRPGHVPEAPGCIDAFERELAAVHQLAARGAEDAVQRVRGEDPAGGRHRLDALGDDQRLAMETASLAQHLAGVQADAQLHDGVRMAAVAAGDGALDLLSADDGTTRRLEGHHEPVASVLDDHPALFLHLLLSQGRKFALHGRGSLIAQALVEQRRADEVRRKHGDRALGQLSCFNGHCKTSAWRAFCLKPTRD